MKKIIGLIILIAVLLTVSVHAADTRTVRVEALDLSIDVPAKSYALTPDMDPFRFSHVGYSHHSYTFDEVMEMQDQMKKQEIALRVWITDPAFDFVLKAEPAPYEDLGLLGNDMLDSLLERLKTDAEEKGVPVSDARVFRDGQTVFLRLETQTERDGVQAQMIVYETMRDYQVIGAVLTYKAEWIPEKYRTIADEMIASIRFGEDAAADAGTDAADAGTDAADAGTDAAAETGADAGTDAADAGTDAAAETGADAGSGPESSVFEDSTGGLRFPVPAGWSELGVDSSLVSGTSEPVLCQAFFSSPGSPGGFVCYECRDLMEKLPGLFQQYLPRSEINQDTVTISTVKKIMPGKVERAKERSLGGRDFYVLECSGCEEALGGMGSEAVFVVHVHNGMMYMFQFVGTADDPRFADVLSMAESAEFTSNAPEGEAADPSFEAGVAAGQKAARAVGRITDYVLIAAIAAGIVVYLVRRRKKSAGRRAAAAAACAACGAPLEPGETVCPYCGTGAGQGPDPSVHQ